MHKLKKYLQKAKMIRWSGLKNKKNVNVHPLPYLFKSRISVEAIELGGREGAEEAGDGLIHEVRVFIRFRFRQKCLNHKLIRFLIVTFNADFLS